MIRCLNAEKWWFNECWVSPDGTIIDVADGHPVNTAKNILISILGQDEYQKLKNDCKNECRREDTILCEEYHWIHIKPAYRAILNNGDMYSDDLVWCKIPQDGRLSFEQIEIIHDMTGWEYIFGATRFCFYSTPASRVNKDKFQRYLQDSYI